MVTNATCFLLLLAYTETARAVQDLYFLEEIMKSKSSLRFQSRLFPVLVIASLLIQMEFTTPAQAAPVSAPQASELSELSCLDSLGCVTIGPGDPIHIAYALVISGPDSSLGIDSRNGVEIAIDDSGGQILGHDIQFDGQDDGCSPEGGLAAGTALAADTSIVAVIGTSCSSAARAAMPLLSAAGLAMVSPSNTAPDLTESGNSNNYPGYLRVSWNDKAQGAAAAQFAREYLGVSTAATVKDGSPYSDYLQQTFADEFTNLGGTITAQEAIDPGDEADMSAKLTSIAAGTPELLYMPIFVNAGGYIIGQAGGMAGLETTFLMGADGLYTPDIVTAAGEQAIEGFMLTSPDFTKFGAAYTDTFLPAYRAKFGEPTSIFHAHAYDAFMLIKAAIEDAAVVDGDSIQIGRQALRNALYGTTDYAGLTGTLTCSATGDCGDPQIAAYEFRDGQYPPNYIWPDFAPMDLTANCDSGNLIQSVEANDEDTVTFNLCRSDATFLSKIAMQPFAIYPQKWLEATSGPDNRTTRGLEHPIGTGPYMFDEWDKGNSITFVKNPDYWDTAPEADTLTFRWDADPAARLLELQNETIDGFDNVAPDDIATIETDTDLNLLSRPSLNTFYIGMTNTFTPFNNVGVRQAVAMSLDRQKIVDDYYPSGSEVATHFTPCSIPNGCVGDDWYAKDLDTAQALLTAAGYPTGFDTHLYYRNNVRPFLPQPGAIAQEVHDQLLTNLNINAEIVEMNSADFLEQVGAGNLDGFYLLGWTADYPHVSNFLDYHFGQNNHQFGDPFAAIYDELNAALQYADPDLAAPYYTDANNAIRDLVPMVPVAHAKSAVAYLDEVTNPQASPILSDLFAVSDPGGRNEFKWMQGYEPQSLFCADESDGDSLRACRQVMQTLYAYENNGSDVEPSLATFCEPNGDLTVWVCDLRQNVKFHDGTSFDANDVVATFTMGLDASSATHKGNSNYWNYYYNFWGVVNCHTLMLGHTGSGSDPTASPTNSAGCPTGSYIEGESISLSDALPATGWRISSWTGTSNNSSTTSTNTISMPASDHTAKVNYSQIPYIYYSTAAQDGWVLESGETTSKGGSISATASTLRIGDDAAKKQYRGILSFSTGSSLPDTAVITKVTLKVRKQGIVGGGNPVTTFQGFMVDIKKGYFGTSALQTADFQTTASKTYGPFKPALSSSWYNIDLTGGQSYINKLSSSAGLTQIRLRFKLDDNNNTTTNYLSLYSGNAGSSYRPQLVIEYYVP
jgi:peptide/nickel transport system substrate-binding protein